MEQANVVFTRAKKEYLNIPSPCRPAVEREVRRVEPKRGESMEQPIIVAGTFADLERVVRELCEQIDLLAAHIPEEEDRAYAELAKEYLWRMYRSAYQRALAREGLGQ